MEERTDTERLAFLYSGVHTRSMALVHLECRLLDGETITIAEVRAAIDAAMTCT